VEGGAQPRVIVVVDDDDDVRESIRAALEDHGYAVVCAVNGRDALAAIASREPPYAIVHDLWMPVMDGWQLQQQLQLDPRMAAVPILVVTAAVVDAASVGAAAVLRKPVRLEALLDALAKLDR